MKRSENRILTTHVGSLIRPQKLRDLAAAANESPEKKQGYEDFLRESVTEVVRMQAKVGIDIINDGEFGKSSWSNYILERITGFEHRPEQLRPVYWLGRDRDRFPEVMAAEFPWITSGVPTEACVGPIKYRDRGSIDRDIANLKAALRAVNVEEAFLPVVAPASSAYDGVNEYYPTEKEYVYAIADALHEEYRAIYDAGLIVQVDDAVLANMYDHYVEQSPEKYRQWAGLRIEALNHALEGIPEDRVRYHVCFGSWHVPHLADAPLEENCRFYPQRARGCVLHRSGESASRA
jgi:5-methyltetrahydropteroyltriglutamate--homocysteine methyltransferase